MITSNNVSINSSGNIIVNISAGVGYTITSAKLWRKQDFKDYTLARDFSFKLEQVNNNEIFILEPDEVNLINFNGLYFLEFETDEPDEDECETCPNPLLVVVTDFTYYYACLTELILAGAVCSDNLFSREVCDDNSINKALSISLLIDGVEQCLELGQFIEANLLLEKIEKLCSKCSACKKINKASTCESCGTYTY